MSLPRIPDHEVLDRVGAGGMGEVYRARRTLDGRYLAIKIEGERSAQDPEAKLRERFLREARILQGIKHENLPEFFGAGELPDGRIFIAMELLVGRSLADLTGQSLEALIPLFVQCARALQVTSEAGIVHRDVSPDNFFVVEVGGCSVVKLIDFGISRDAAATSDGLTRIGTFMGKADYCSPEQTGLLPGHGSLDWRTDLYSFGLTMFSVILGKLPFHGTTFQEQLNARLTDLPREALADIHSSRLRKLLARMLRRLPRERIGSFDEVVAELLRAQAGLAEELATQLDRNARIRQRAARTPARDGVRAAKPGSVDATLPLRNRSFDLRSFTSPRGLAVIAGLLLAGSLLTFAIRPSADESADDLSQEGESQVPSSALSTAFLVFGLGAASASMVRRRSLRASTASVELPPATRVASATPGALDSQGLEYLGDPASGPLLSYRFIVSGDGPTRNIGVIGNATGLPPAEILVGRAPRGACASIRLSSRLASGLQARLAAQHRTFSIENLSQTNATCVNGKELLPTERRLLSHGDRIEIGPIVITFLVS